MRLQRYRDQGRNISDCLEKLTAMLSEVARPPRRRRPTKPSKSAVQKRLSSKQAHSKKKQRRRVLPETRPTSRRWPRKPTSIAS